MLVPELMVTQNLEDQDAPPGYSEFLAELYLTHWSKFKCLKKKKKKKEVRVVNPLRCIAYGRGSASVLGFTLALSFSESCEG